MNTAPARRGIVITRPAGEVERLAALIRAAGGVPLLYPTIDILDALDPRPLDDAIARLDEFDLAIFISPSAVAKAMTRIRSRRTLPPRLKCAAIGPGGVRALQRFGVNDVIAPAPDSARHDSEALLAAAFLRDLRGKRVVIFRGDGGRELLRDTLAARGAVVEAVTCYRRAKPTFDAALLIGAWQRDEVAALIATSSEGLGNLCEHLGAAGEPWLRDTPTVVPHPRIAAAARDLGLRQVVVCAAGDEALAATAMHQVRELGG